MSPPVVNIVVILVNQTKKISRDFTRFAIISQPKVQITQNNNLVEANYIAYHIIVNFYKTDIQLSQKKCSFNDALLLTHAVHYAMITDPYEQKVCRKRFPASGVARVGQEGARAPGAT